MNKWFCYLSIGFVSIYSQGAHVPLLSVPAQKDYRAIKRSPVSELQFKNNISALRVTGNKLAAYEEEGVWIVDIANVDIANKDKMPQKLDGWPDEAEPESKQAKWATPLLACSPNSACVAATSLPHKLLLADISGDKPRMLASTQKSPAISALAFSPDSSVLCVGRHKVGKSTLELFDLDTSTTLQKYNEIHETNRVKSVAFSHLDQGTYSLACLLDCGRTDTMIIRKLSRENLTSGGYCPLTLLGDKYDAIDITPSGEQVSVSSNKEVKVLNSSGTEVWNFSARGISFSKLPQEFYPVYMRDCSVYQVNCVRPHEPSSTATSLDVYGVRHVDHADISFKSDGSIKTIVVSDGNIVKIITEDTGGSSGPEELQQQLSEVRSRIRRLRCGGGCLCMVLTGLLIYFRKEMVAILTTDYS